MSETFRVWQGVASDKQQEWQIIFSQPSAGIDVNGACPICQSHTLHRYYDGIGPKLRGGLWEWCSSCYSYEHHSAKIPEWWTDSLDLKNIEVTAEPEALEIARQTREVTFHDGTIIESQHDLIAETLTLFIETIQPKQKNRRSENLQFIKGRLLFRAAMPSENTKRLLEQLNSSSHIDLEILKFTSTRNGEIKENYFDTLLCEYQKNPHRFRRLSINSVSIEWHPDNF